MIRALLSGAGTNISPAIHPTRLVVSEFVGRPGEFAIECHDPTGVGWGEGGVLLGQAVGILLPGGGQFEGVVGGRDIRRGRGETESFTLRGYDRSVRLVTPVRCRCFGPTALAEIVAELASGVGLKGRVSLDGLGRFDGRTQVTQYLESDFAFLRRIASVLGGSIWPYRGELHVGAGPGADLDPVEITEAHVTGLDLQEDWTTEPRAHCFPRFGTAFPDSPKMEDWEPEKPLPQKRDSREERILEGLAAEGAWHWPGGVALGESESAIVAESHAVGLRAERTWGVVELGRLPDGPLVLGQPIALRYRGVELSRGVVKGITHRIEGEVVSASVHIGRLDGLRPEWRPARHCWTAVVKTPVVDERATVTVSPLGWDESSKPLDARVMVAVAAKDKVMLRGPEPGELVLLAFQEGDPDQPVVLGALVDLVAPPEASKPNTLVAFKSASGGFEVSITDGNLRVDLEKLGLELRIGDKLLVKSKGDARVEAGGKVTLTAKGNPVELEGSKIDLKKG